MINIVQIGLGRIGCDMVRLIRQRKGLKIIAAVDYSPEKAGRDLGEICSLPPLGITVHKDLKSALRKKNIHVAILATVSDLRTVKEQIEEIASAGINIVSTCEELSFPWEKQPELAREIDNICKRNKVTCLATGVNPGFLMDFLPWVMSSICQKIQRITVQRVQDASGRRIAFQQKIGVGLTPNQFQKERARGRVSGHLGLTESLHMLACGLGWKLDSVKGTMLPVIARKNITTTCPPIKPGMVCGVEQKACGYRGKKEVIRLFFRAVAGEKKPCDSIEIIGIPQVKLTIPGGINGDIATCAIAVNAIRVVVNSQPGLKTMIDLPAPGFSEDFNVKDE